MSIIGRTLAGRYKVLSLLGKGGMGAVYEADHLDLRRRVAVKVLATDADPDQLLRFKQEALAAAGLAHPNIVQVFDFIDGDEPLLVMELLRGQSLAALIKRGGKLEPERAVSLMTQVLSALAAAHDARIVHRDVKPENIFVCESPLPYELVKVLDFGLARPLDESRHIAQTRMGLAMGTPAYMAPEQARGSSADVRMDVFAAGVTLYYMLAGRRPFEGKTTSELVRAVSKQPPIPLDMVCTDLDLGLVRVVERSLSKDPDARFASAKEFLEALTPFWTRATGAPAPAREARPTSAKNTTTAGGQKKRAATTAPTTLPEKPKGLRISELDVRVPAIAIGMITYARFAPDGASALAIGPSGLARWTLADGWSSRELPKGVSPSHVRGIAMGESEALLFGASTYVRSRSGYAAVDVPQGLFAHGAHIDSFSRAGSEASRVTVAGLLSNGVTANEGVVAVCAEGTVTIHHIGRGIEMHGVARAPNGAIIACGTRGTVCVIDDRGVHAHIAGRATLRAITPIGEGFVAVGDDGAMVYAPAATSVGVASAAEQRFVAVGGARLDDDLTAVRASLGPPPGTLACALGRRVHIGDPLGGVPVLTVRVEGIVRDAWMAPSGAIRILLDNASVIEGRALDVGDVSGGP